MENATEQILNRLEQGNEETNLNRIKDHYHLYSERNARTILYILENTPDKFADKINKEIRKLEAKKLKEVKKISKRLNSYHSEYQGEDRLSKIETSIKELKSLVH